MHMDIIRCNFKIRGRAIEEDAWHGSLTSTCTCTHMSSYRNTTCTHNNMQASLLCLSSDVTYPFQFSFSHTHSFTYNHILPLYCTVTIYNKGLPRATWLSELSTVTWHTIISFRLRSQPNLTGAGTEGPHSEKRNKEKTLHSCLWVETEHGVWQKWKSVTQEREDIGLGWGGNIQTPTSGFPSFASPLK